MNVDKGNVVGATDVMNTADDQLKQSSPLHGDSSGDPLAAGRPGVLGGSDLQPAHQHARRRSGADGAVPGNPRTRLLGSAARTDPGAATPIAGDPFGLQRPECLRWNYA